LICSTTWLRRCSPWWSLSRTACCESNAPLRHLQPGTSKLRAGYLLNFKCCCAFGWWVQPRRSSQAQRGRRLSGSWPGDSGDSPHEAHVTSPPQLHCSDLRQEWMPLAPVYHSFPQPDNQGQSFERRKKKKKNFFLQFLLLPLLSSFFFFYYY